MLSGTVRRLSLTVLFPLALALALACRGPSDDRAGPEPLGTAPRAGCSAPIAAAEGVRGAFIGTRFGPLALFERTDSGAEAALSTDDLRRPCDRAAPRLLVVRLDAPWCGTCVASAERFAAVVAPLSATLVVLDVVFSGLDNGPTKAEDLVAWHAAHPSMPGHVARARDATVADLLRLQRVAPAVFLVELDSMRIVDVFANPTSDKVDSRIRRALSGLGAAAPRARDGARAPLTDARFSPEDWAVLQTMRARGTPPADPTNAHADDPAAAELGRALFSDASLGGGHAIACVTCHAPSRGFTDGRPTARGAGSADLNTLGLGPAAYNRWWFWDGRADSLWAQATSPLENPREMNGTRLGVAHRVMERYRGEYERVFGALPELRSRERFPRAGKPGQSAFDGMSKSDQAAVTRVFVNAAKAIAAFERTLRPRRSRLDAYLDGEMGALTTAERDGMKAFIEGGCAVCHHGPMLTDGAFHDIHVPSSPGFPATQGRSDGVRALLASAFRADGPFSDAPAEGARLSGLVPVDTMLGQLKTPSLRDLTFTGPWGHGGTFKTLEAVIGHYDMEELTDSAPGRIGLPDPAAVAFSPSPDQLDALVSFLRAVGGGDSAPPRG